MSGISDRFPRYEEFEPTVPVWCVTPDEGRTIHRFFDTSPFSPSGRYLALTRFPYEDRMPQCGDEAEIVLVDLQDGTKRVVARTRGWDTQLGAQAQWGADDTELFFNDLDVSSWKPFGVKLNPFTGEARKLDGTIYMVSRDGKRALSPCLLRTARTQRGYGVVVPPEMVPENRGATDDDGVFLTDTRTGETKLLVSIGQIVESLASHLQSPRYEGGDFYGFHVKWNLQGTRIMFVLRWLPRDEAEKARSILITMGADGSDIRIAVPDTEWTDKGGHHPNWCPDGEYGMMNLRIHGDAMRLVRFKYDGADLAPMHDEIIGSGHPSMHPNGRHIVTDAYPGEPIAFGDGTVPIRFIDIREGSEQTLARIRTVPPYEGEKRALRVDPHPAWDYQFRRIAFNACPDGTRRVYVADVSELIERCA